MPHRYEAATADDARVVVIDGASVADTADDGAIWVDEDPPAGAHAIAIGNPWSTAYAVTGTIDELETWAVGVVEKIRAVRPENLPATATPVFDVRDHFTPEELETLVVTAAEALQGNPENLTSIQIRLAERAYAIFLADDEDAEDEGQAGGDDERSE